MPMMICWSLDASPARGAKRRPPYCDQVPFAKPMPEYEGPTIDQLPDTSQMATCGHLSRG
jgi:hypothetical protein